MEYTYDTMNRLTAEVSGNAGVQYHYDRKGNRIRQEYFHGERVVNKKWGEGQIRCPIQNFLNDSTEGEEENKGKSSAKGKRESDRILFP